MAEQARRDAQQAAKLEEEQAGLVPCWYCWVYGLLIERWFRNI